MTQLPKLLHKILIRPRVLRCGWPRVRLERIGHWGVWKKYIKKNYILEYFNRMS